MSNDIYGAISMLQRITQDHLLLLFLLLVTLASAADLAADLSEGVDTAHLIQETIIMLIAGGMFLWLALKLRQSSQAIQQLHQELESSRNLAQPKAVIAAKQQLSAVIAEQFTSWGLSKSEKEVGLLLLKGFSLKEIAALRGTAEKTIRQQASSIYKKSDVAGRHAFSAWFIEDCL